MLPPGAKLRNHETARGQPVIDISAKRRGLDIAISSSDKMLIVPRRHHDIDGMAYQINAFGRQSNRRNCWIVREMRFDQPRRGRVRKSRVRISMYIDDVLSF